MDQQSIQTLARAVVARLAPAELPLFDPISRAWFADPGRVRRGKASDEILSFGIMESVSLLTPVALAAASQVGVFLLQEFGKDVAKDAAGVAFGKIKQAIGQDKPAGLTAQQLAHVRAVALAAGLKEKLAEPQAQQMADAVAAELASG